MQKPAHHYLHFTKKERRGTLVLVIIILLVICFPFIYSLIFMDKIEDADNIDEEIASLKTSPDSSRKTYYTSGVRYMQQGKTEDHVAAKELFYFDPNTLAI